MQAMSTEAGLLPLIVERTTTGSGQAWSRLRLPQGLREVFTMVGLHDAEIAASISAGAAAGDWYWKAGDELSVLFRHEADARRAAARYNDHAE
jgi:hypothetical protein